MPKQPKAVYFPLKHPKALVVASAFCHLAVLVLILIVQANVQALFVALAIWMLSILWQLYGWRQMVSVQALEFSGEHFFLQLSGQQKRAAKIRGLFLTRFLVVVTYRIQGHRFGFNRYLVIVPASMVEPEAFRTLRIFLKDVPL